MSDFSVLVFLWFGNGWLITSLEFFYSSKFTLSSKHFLQLLLNSFISFAFITLVLPLRFFFETVYVLNYRQPDERPSVGSKKSTKRKDSSNPQQVEKFVQRCSMFSIGKAYFVNVYILLLLLESIAIGSQLNQSYLIWGILMKLSFKC